MIELFTGPAALAQLVREELLKRGVGAEIRSLNPFTMFYSSAFGGSAGLQSVLVTEEAAEKHRAAIDDVLALVSEPDEETGEEASEPGEKA